MKDHQFEEITFWFSLIACLLSYHSNIIWMQGILSIVCVFININDSDCLGICEEGEK